MSDTEQKVSSLVNVRQKQANAIDNSWHSEKELVEEYKAGQTLTDYAGIGPSTANKIEAYIHRNYSDAKKERRRNSEGIATEFGTDGEQTDQGELIWWFICPRCGAKNPCKGDPQGFAGRPYGCASCGWVAALEGSEMDEIRSVDTGTEQEGDDD